VIQAASTAHGGCHVSLNGLLEFKLPGAWITSIPSGWGQYPISNTDHLSLLATRIGRTKSRFWQLFNTGPAEKIYGLEVPPFCYLNDLNIAKSKFLLVNSLCTCPHFFWITGHSCDRRGPGACWCMAGAESAGVSSCDLEISVQKTKF